MLAKIYQDKIIIDSTCRLLYADYRKETVSYTTHNRATELRFVKYNNKICLYDELTNILYKLNTTYENFANHIRKKKRFQTKTLISIIDNIDKMPEKITFFSPTTKYNYTATLYDIRYKNPRIINNIIECDTYDEVKAYMQLKRTKPIFCQNNIVAYLGDVKSEKEDNIFGYMIKTVYQGGLSYGKFKYPLKQNAEVVAKDFTKNKMCGGGLHGLIHDTFHHLIFNNELWLILKYSKSKSIVVHDEKIKVPFAHVIAWGNADVIQSLFELLTGKPYTYQYAHNIGDSFVVQQAASCSKQICNNNSIQITSNSSKQQCKDKNVQIGKADATQQCCNSNIQISQYKSKQVAENYNIQITQSLSHQQAINNNIQIGEHSVKQISQNNSIQIAKSETEQICQENGIQICYGEFNRQFAGDGSICITNGTSTIAKGKNTLHILRCKHHKKYYILHKLLTDDKTHRLELFYDDKKQTFQLQDTIIYDEE